MSGDVTQSIDDAIAAGNEFLDALFEGGRRVTEKYGRVNGDVITAALAAFMATGVGRCSDWDLVMFYRMRDRALTIINRHFDKRAELIAEGAKCNA